MRSSRIKQGLSGSNEEWSALAGCQADGEDFFAEQVERKYVSSGYSEAKKTFLWGDIKQKQKTRARNGFGQTGWIAADYALLGEKNKAFEWPDKDFREGGIAWDLKVSDHFELLRSDPRFQDFLHRLDLPIDLSMPIPATKSRFWTSSGLLGTIRRCLRAASNLRSLREFKSIRWVCS